MLLFIEYRIYEIKNILKNGTQSLLLTHGVE